MKSIEIIKDLLNRKIITIDEFITLYEDIVNRNVWYPWYPSFPYAPYYTTTTTSYNITSSDTATASDLPGYIPNPDLVSTTATCTPHPDVVQQTTTN